MREEGEPHSTNRETASQTFWPLFPKVASDSGCPTQDTLAQILNGIEGSNAQDRGCGAWFSGGLSTHNKAQHPRKAIPWYKHLRHQKSEAIFENVDLSVSVSLVPYSQKNSLPPLLTPIPKPWWQGIRNRSLTTSISSYIIHTTAVSYLMLSVHSKATALQFCQVYHLLWTKARPQNEYQLMPPGFVLKTKQSPVYSKAGMGLNLFNKQSGVGLVF